MATLNTTLRNTLADALGGVIDRLEILDGATVLVTATITFGSASSGAVTVDPGAATAVATGTADGARYYSSGGSDEISGLTVTVTSGGGDVELDSLSITSGQSVDLSAATITVPAS